MHSQRNDKVSGHCLADATAGALADSGDAASAGASGTKNHARTSRGANLVSTCSAHERALSFANPQANSCSKTRMHASTYLDVIVGGGARENGHNLAMKMGKWVVDTCPAPGLELELCAL